MSGAPDRCDNDAARPGTEKSSSGKGELGRVLFVTSSFPRWAGDSTTPFILHLAQDLRRLGWDVRILAPHAPGALRSEILGGVPVERFRYLIPESLQTVCYQGGALINLQVNRWNLAKVPVLVLAEWFALRRSLIRMKPDLVHSHWILPQGFVCALAAPSLKVPHVATIHGGDIFALNGRVPRFCKRLALSLADAVTVNSSATREAVAHVAPGLKWVIRIPMGVSDGGNANPGAGQVLRARYMRGRGPLVTFVGRLVEEKGVTDLLSAISLLSNRLPNLTALIVGDGQHRCALERLTRRLGLSDRVTFVGWVQPEEISNYLRAADIFVGPSKQSRDGWREAQGLTFIEAMLAGTPVIAGNVGGVAEAIQHEHTGLLVRPGSAIDIAESIERLFNDRELAARLRENGIASARARFTREASARAFSTLYDQVLSVRRGNNPFSGTAGTGLERSNR